MSQIALKPLLNLVFTGPVNGLVGNCTRKLSKIFSDLTTNGQNNADQLKFAADQIALETQEQFKITMTCLSAGQPTFTEANTHVVGFLNEGATNIADAILAVGSIVVGGVVYCEGSENKENIAPNFSTGSSRRDVTNCMASVKEGSDKDAAAKSLNICFSNTPDPDHHIHDTPPVGAASHHFDTAVTMVL